MRMKRLLVAGLALVAIAVMSGCTDPSRQVKAPVGTTTLTKAFVETPTSRVPAAPWDEDDDAPAVVTWGVAPAPVDPRPADAYP
jgi:hypothetical protein